MVVSIHPSQLSGTIQAAASKSSMQRACAAALAASGTSVITNPGHSNDDLAALDIIRKMGATVEEKDGKIFINTDGIHQSNQTEKIAINCGESGLSIRMFTPLVALSSSEITINGKGSLVTRPMDFFDEVLPKLGVCIQSNNGKLPLVIKGPLKPSNIEIDGSLSSQFLTGLLLAYSAAGASDVTIKVNNLKSKPYVDLTLEVMRQFGLKLPENRKYEEFYFDTNYANYTNGANEANGANYANEYRVEGDWSGAAFLLVAGAVAGPLIVKGLDLNSTQADKAIVQALVDTVVGISLRDNEIELRPAPLKAFHFNATDCPDLFPPLVALASYCTGKTVIEGVSRLAHKESNRGLTLQDEFGKMGIRIDLQDDIMIVYGGTGVHAATVHSRHDHRIAMACAVAALKADGEVQIEEAEAVNKSYPDFYEHLVSMGVELKKMVGSPGNS